MCVTTTGIDKEDKTEIQKKIERMAGIYSNSFHEGVTHLVAEVGNNIKKLNPGLQTEWPVSSQVLPDLALLLEEILQKLDTLIAKITQTFLADGPLEEVRRGDRKGSSSHDQRMGRRRLGEKQTRIGPRYQQNVRQIQVSSLQRYNSTCLYFDHVESCLHVSEPTFSTCEVFNHVESI